MRGSLGLRRSALLLPLATGFFALATAIVVGVGAWFVATDLELPAGDGALTAAIDAAAAAR